MLLWGYPFPSVRTLLSFYVRVPLKVLFFHFAREEWGKREEERRGEARHSPNQFKAPYQIGWRPVFAQAPSLQPPSKTSLPLSTSFTLSAGERDRGLGMGRV